jgi:hypothetical protein
MPAIAVNQRVSAEEIYGEPGRFAGWLLSATIAAARRGDAGDARALATALASMAPLLDPVTEFPHRSDPEFC